MNMMEKAVKALRRITASRNRGAKEKIKIRFLVLFPAWEKIFPHWETIIPILGIFEEPIAFTSKPSVAR